MTDSSYDALTELVLNCTSFVSNLKAQIRLDSPSVEVLETTTDLFTRGVEIGRITIADIRDIDNLASRRKGVAALDALLGNIRCNSSQKTDPTRIRLEISAYFFDSPDMETIRDSLLRNSLTAEIHFDYNFIFPTTAYPYLFIESHVVTELHLNSSEMGCAGAMTLAKALMEDEVLKKLDLSEGLIDTKGMKALADAMVINKKLKLEELNLGKNSLGDKGANIIANVLAQRHMRIKKLCLRGNSIGNEGVKALMNALIKNVRYSVLKSLDLAQNIFGSEGATAIANFLTKLPSLPKSLSLSSDKWNFACTNALADSLHPPQIKAQHIPLLKVLDLSDTKLQDADLETLFKALSRNYSFNISKLKLSNNKISDDGAKAIAGILSLNPYSLTELCLNSNDIGDEGMKAIAQALKNNYALKILNLNYNKIGAEGGYAIADALISEGIALMSLSIKKNSLDEGSVVAIAHSLMYNRSVTQLLLGGNKIGDAGAKEFAAALLKNSTLTELSLYANLTGDEGIKAIANALICNATLIRLDMQGSKIGKEGVKAIVDAMKQNRTIVRLVMCSRTLDDDMRKSLKSDVRIDA
ncbi:MAG TPA: hypothetical protein V6C97_27625 [Oculatellaceae cyanobacterium]